MKKINILIAGILLITALLTACGGEAPSLAGYWETPQSVLIRLAEDGTFVAYRTGIELHRGSYSYDGVQFSLQQVGDNERRSQVAYEEGVLSILGSASWPAEDWLWVAPLSVDDTPPEEALVGAWAPKMGVLVRGGDRIEFTADGTVNLYDDGVLYDSKAYRLLGDGLMEWSSAESSDTKEYHLLGGRLYMPPALELVRYQTGE